MSMHLHSKHVTSPGMYGPPTVLFQYLIQHSSGTFVQQKQLEVGQISASEALLAQSWQAEHQWQGCKCQEGGPRSCIIPP